MVQQSGPKLHSDEQLASMGKSPDRNLSFPESVQLASSKETLSKVQSRFGKLGMYIFPERTIASLMQELLDEKVKGALSASPKDLEKIFRAAIPHLHKTGQCHQVIACLKELGATEALREYSHMLYSKGEHFDAYYGFKAIGFKAGMFSSARRFERSHQIVWSDSNSGLCSDYAEDLLVTAPLQERFKEWLGGRFPGMELEGTGGSSRAILMAHTLAKHYDCGIAIAKKGLPGGFFMQLFGMPVHIAESHVEGRDTESQSTSFNWITTPKAADFTGKRVLLIDNDIVTGLTLQRVGAELQKFSPASVAVALTDCAECNMHIKHCIYNVPGGIEVTHTTNEMNSLYLAQACRKVHELLQK
jgi:hypothetical protein